MPLTRPPLSFLNSNSTVFNDPLLVLHQGSTSNDSDVGFVFNRANGLVSNVAVYWSETDKSFYTAFTDSGGAGDANLVPTSYAPITVGTLNANNAVVTGNLTVSGLTTTINTTNSTISHSLIELNSGAGSNTNDLGFIFERGSTGDNAAIIWDESADVFVLGTTTATGASTGDLTVSQVGLHAGSITINSAYTFPTSDGTADQVLTTNGSGTLSFATISGGGSPGGSDTQVQFNDGGSFGGDAGLTYNKTTDLLTGVNITATGNVSLGDSNYLNIGAGPDLSVYHDGSNSYIDDVGTGSLFVRSGTTYFQNAAGEKTSISTNAGAGQSIYHNNALKLVTTATGIDVTGTVAATSLEVSATEPYITISSTDSQTGNAIGGIRFDTIDPSYAAGGYPAYITAQDISVNGSAFGLVFGTQNAERMRINHLGRVGIGNASPASPLTVAGVIESTSGGIKFPDNTTQTTAASAGITEATAIEYAIALG